MTDLTLFDVLSCASSRRRRGKRGENAALDRGAENEIPIKQALIFGIFGRDNLKSHRCSQFIVSSLVNISHAPTTDLFDDRVTLAEIFAWCITKANFGQFLLVRSVCDGFVLAPEG